MKNVTALGADEMQAISNNIIFVNNGGPVC